MNRTMKLLLVVSAFYLSSVGYGAESWDRFLAEVAKPHVTPEEALVILQGRTPHEQENLCSRVLEPEFFDLAHQRHLSIFTRNSLVSYCQSFSRPKEEISVNTLESDRYPQGPSEWQSQQRSVSTLEIIDRDAQTLELEPPRGDKDMRKLNPERIQLFEELQKIKEDLRSHVYSEGKHAENIQSINNTIADIQTRLQNVDVNRLPETDRETYLTMFEDMQIQLSDAQDQVVKARNAYDDLSVAIGVLRDDISEYNRGGSIGDVDLKEYQDAAHEDYLKAISHPDVIDALPALFSEQIKGAQQLWTDAQVHLSNAQDILQSLGHD